VTIVQRALALNYRLDLCGELKQFSQKGWGLEGPFRTES
jgi:hypothetical protein